MKRLGAFLALCGVLVALASCGDDADGGGGSNGSGGGSGVGGADVPAGSTAFVAIVNPIVNDGHSTGVPAEAGTARDGLAVTVDPGGADTTANEGLAVVEVSAGPIDVLVGAAPALAHTVVAQGDVYDAAIAYDGSGSAFFEVTPIRYAVGSGSGAILFEPGDAFEDVNARLGEDDTVVVLRPGTYTGNLVITGERVLLFGEGWSERAVLIDGSVTANGGGVRLRGLTITGDLTSNGNNFGISFSAVYGTTDIKGNGGAFLRNVFCGTTRVPSSNATLLDNRGVPPATTLPSGVCP